MMNFEKMLVETRLSNQAVDALNEASMQAYGNYSYAAGYLGSMLVRAMNEMPKHRRAEFRQILAQQTKELEKQILVK
jgi:hypothetical protein